jgi:sugar fermentation stimulation protein A
MTTCCEVGRPVFLSMHDDPKRKLKYTWELIEMPTSLVGVNTRVPNLLVEQSLKAGAVDGLDGYDQIRREVAVGRHSRLDLMLSKSERDRCYVEIKNCTLVEERVAMFPDAVTTRGQKHLGELERLVVSGNRAVIFFLVQRMDADLFRPADQIDPAYGQALRHAAAAGVEIMVFDVTIDMKRITLHRRLAVEMD